MPIIDWFRFFRSFRFSPPGVRRYAEHSVPRNQCKRRHQRRAGISHDGRRDQKPLGSTGDELTETHSEGRQRHSAGEGQLGLLLVASADPVFLLSASLLDELWGSQREREREIDLGLWFHQWSMCVRACLCAGLPACVRSAWFVIDYNAVNINNQINVIVFCWLSLALLLRNRLALSGFFWGEVSVCTTASGFWWVSMTISDLWF